MNETVNCREKERVTRNKKIAAEDNFSKNENFDQNY